MDDVTSGSARDRTLHAAMDLLAREGRAGVSTRAVSAAAGIQPQTIYRQFGDMDGLLAAAANEGFQRYLASKSSRPASADPVDNLRAGWDLHVEFGVQHPALYLLMYGTPDASFESSAAAQTAVILRDLVAAVARAGLLRIDLETAVAMIQSTGIGVVLTLIGTPGTPGPESPLSLRVREAVLDAIVERHETPASTAASPADAAAVAASTLRAALPAADVDLSTGETILLDEILTRIGAAGHPTPRT